MSEDEEDELGSSAEPLAPEPITIETLRRDAQLEYEATLATTRSFRKRNAVMITCSVLAVVLCVNGAQMLQGADESHTHDWKFTTCELTAAWTGNTLGQSSKDSATCVFYSVRPAVAPASNQGRDACAVLADFSDHALSSAPACSVDAMPVPGYALQWAASTCWANGTCWPTNVTAAPTGPRRAIASTPAAQSVECLVPRHVNYVPDTRCHEAATTAGTVEGFSRAYHDRLVYVVHDRDEISEVTHRATAPQRTGGAIVLALGIVTALGAAVCCAFAYARRAYRQMFEKWHAHQLESQARKEQEFKTP